MCSSPVFTGADVQDMVVSILGLDSVHCNLGQLSSAWLCLQKDRSVMLREDRAIHHRMGAHEPQNLVRKLLRAGEASTVHFTGTLMVLIKKRNYKEIRRPLIVSVLPNVKKS